MNRKITESYYFSVEGETEKWYLEWLQGKINKSGKNNYKVKFNIKVEKNSLSTVRGYSFLDLQDMTHIFDFEDEKNEEAFKNVLDNMYKAKDNRKVKKYHLGYCNYTLLIYG